MKTVLFAALASAYLLLGAACSTPINGQAVINGVHSACGIVVPLADIAALVAANPALSNVDSAVNAICSAFKAHNTRAATAAPAVSGTLVINGVLVHYEAK